VTEGVKEVIRRVLRDDPTVEVRYTFAIRPGSFHQGVGVLFVHPSHESVVAAVRAQARGQL